MSTRTFVGRCKRCKASARFEAERVVTPLGVDKYGAEMRRVEYRAPWCESTRRLESPNHDGSISVRCLCGGFGRFYPLTGREGKQKCGARCRSSTGHVCECKCKGANHGAAHV